MKREPAYRTAVCDEYEALLHKCKAALDDFQRRQEAPAEQNESKLAKALEVTRLREYFERVYARLVQHYERCDVCQSTKKIKVKTLRRSGLVPLRKWSA